MAEKRKWTESQIDAINASGQATVVSAAAGSGKTSVLIERIIKNITENKWSVSDLLIVTFTRAATAEIRTRLATAVADKLKENPSDPHLALQQMLIPSADIFTIDAFCSDLVRENFSSLKISPDFKTIDEGFSEIYKNEALTRTLDKYYNEATPEFEALSLILKPAYFSKFSLEGVIKDLYEKCEAHSNPSKTLEESISYYLYDGSVKDSPMLKEFIGEFLKYADYLLAGIKHGMDFCERHGYVSTYNVLSADYTVFAESCELIKDADFPGFLEKVKDYNIPRWASPPDKAAAEDFDIKSARHCRDITNGFIKKNGEELINYFKISDFPTIDKENKAMIPVLSTLLNIVKDYKEEYDKIKAEKNAFDFSDIEHMAFDLLIDKDGSKTPLALDLSKKYREILIDEYQDTNELQDKLFTALSDNEKNLFIVGDIKQSIYAFRNAMPALFSEKKKTYPGTILLGENFRSSFGIVSYVNFIFSQIMSEEIGDIDYSNKKEQLEYGRKDPVDKKRVDVELHLLPLKSKLPDEGKFIAKYIKEAMEKDSTLRYSDFTVLMRTIKNRAYLVAEQLEAENIPVIFDSSDSFFGTSDTKIILSLLHVIDNPVQDVHMLAVLLSPLFGLSAEKIATLRKSGGLKNSIYSNILSQKDHDEEINRVYEKLRLYRELSLSMPVGELIRTVYEDTLYPQLVAAMQNGAQRQANLFLLLDYADSYEQTEDVGISGFVNYLDFVVENDIELATASLNSGTANAVRIMSIHKSKGLQFKICILPDLGNGRHSEKNPLVFFGDAKFTMNSCNMKTGDVKSTLATAFGKKMAAHQELSEELRMLYVAMTRAEKKLILLGTPSAAGTLTKAKSISGLDEQGRMNPQALFDTGSMLDYILAATLHHVNAHNLRALAGIDEETYEIMPFEAPIKCVCHSEEAAEEESAESIALPDGIDEERVAELRERMDYEYPYLALATVPTKRSATATEAAGFDEKYFASAKPDFIKQGSLSAAQKGTLLHRFMQFADFDKAQRDVKTELARLKGRGYFTGAETDVINTQKIENFFRSDIFARMEKSQDLMREKKFAVLVPASRFNPDLPSELAKETVLIQGIADCVFLEDDKIVIVDYKTDSTTIEEELINRHKAQLMTYAEALSQVLGKDFKEAYIYSFSLDKEIKVI